MSNVTLSDLKTMKEQDVFDYVTRHLFRQGEKCVDGVSCKYRAKRGRRNLECAVGALIPDKYYDKKMENKVINSDDFLNICEEKSVTLSRFMTKNKDLLRDLQQVHDDLGLNNHWKDTKTMKIHLQKVAEKFELDTNVFKGLKLRKRKANGI